MLVEVRFKAITSVTRHGMAHVRRAAKACVSRRSAFIVTQSMGGGSMCGERCVISDARNEY